MTALPPSLVEDTWNELNADPAFARTTISAFRQAQPVLSGFLRAADDHLSEIGGERGSLLMIGVWAWLAFRKAGGATLAITEERVEAAFDANQLILGGLEESDEKNVMDAASDWTETYPQMPLLAGILQHLSGGDPVTDDPRGVDDILGLMMLYSKTAIDCLHAAG